MSIIYALLVFVGGVLIPFIIDMSHHKKPADSAGDTTMHYPLEWFVIPVAICVIVIALVEPTNLVYMGSGLAGTIVYAALSSTLRRWLTEGGRA